MNKTQILMNKLVYLGLSILETSKTVIYESWYDYVKSKYGKKSKIIQVYIWIYMDMIQATL